MPLRDDLLDPIAGENPSGANLRYDKLFDEIKDARSEEDDSLPSGDWSRSAKKADRLLVIKLAVEALAKRSKDLRLTGWYLESLVRKEGFAPLPRGLELLLKLQTDFWDTVHPEKDDDGALDLRVGAVETASTLLALSVKAIPLTRSGFNWVQYQDAKIVGFETESMSDEKSAARKEAIELGRATGEDLQKAIDGTAKGFYVDTELYLEQSLSVLDTLEEFHAERYGDDYPSMGRLKSALHDIKIVLTSVLKEKRKTEPDAEPEAADEPDELLNGDEEASSSPYEQAEPEEEIIEVAAPRKRVAKPAATPVGVPVDQPSAYEQIKASALFLHKLDTSSPVPYLLCSGLRLGETRSAELGEEAFPVAPSTETRQALRRLANERSWSEVMQLCLETMAEPCGRVWLDLQRYAWKAAMENSDHAVARAIASAVRGLLVDLPEVRTITLDDDTPAANAETNQWIDSEILPSAAVAEPVEEQEEEEERYTAPVITASNPNEDAAPDIYDNALEVLRRGRVAEAINMLVRDSEQQPSGRMRFHRRVQMAQLCLTADQPAIAFPVLKDLSSEIERRALESWESGEMLAQPLGLLLRCMQLRDASAEERESIFNRLCRLDPQAALAVSR